MTRGLVRQLGKEAGLRDTGLLDFASRTLDHVLLDGWAVYRVHHKAHKVAAVSSTHPPCARGLYRPDACHRTAVLCSSQWVPLGLATWLATAPPCPGPAQKLPAHELSTERAGPRKNHW